MWHQARMELVTKIIVLCVISYVRAVIHVGVALKGDIGEMPHHHHSTSHPFHRTLPPHQTTEIGENNRTIQLRKNLVDCTEESKVDPDIILNLRSGRWRRIRKEPEALKKWALCLLVKSDMMSQNGVLKQDVVLAHVPIQDRNEVEKVINKCLFKKARRAPEIAWHYVKCFRSKFSKYSVI